MKAKLVTRTYWLTMLVLSCTLLMGTTPANAAWSSPTTKTTGSVSMAPISYTFTPITNGSLNGTAGGTGGATYTSTQVAVSSGAGMSFDIKSNSAVTVNPQIKITAAFTTNPTSAPSVFLASCSVAWTASDTCPPGYTLLASNWTANYYLTVSLGNIATASTLHLGLQIGSTPGRITTSAAVLTSAVRAGIDRTAG